MIFRQTTFFSTFSRNEFNPRLEVVLGLMMRKGADIEMRNLWGETPLHNTCKRGNLESSIYLLENGADINAVDLFGETGMLHFHGSQALMVMTLFPPSCQLCTKLHASVVFPWLRLS